jgi:hypothetical protein
METSNNWTGPTLLDLMSYVEDTPASPLASPVRAKVKKTRGTSGPGYEKPYAFFDPVTQSLKMYEVTCPLAALPSLEKLPASGMTRSGVLFLRPPWEPITDATESSLLHTPTAKMNQMSPSMKSGWWPTPTTQEVEHPDAILNEKGRRISKDGTNSYSLGLADAVKMWRTPTVNDSKNVNPKPNRHGSLVQQVNDAEKVWPTPRAGSMYGGSGSAQIIEQRYSEGTISEEERRSMRAGNGGKLNPTWVEWLMGFPTGWTDLEASETQSSPR